MTCTADCFQDGGELRPLKAPNALVWTYFQVLGSPPGSLESRRFAPCPCECGKLVASPPAGKDSGPSFDPKPVPPKVVTAADMLRNVVAEVTARFGDIHSPGNDPHTQDPNGANLIELARSFDAFLKGPR